MDVVFPPLQAALMYIQFHLSFQVRFQMLLHLDKNEIAPFVSHASVGKGSSSPRAALEPRFAKSAQLGSQYMPGLVTISFISFIIASVRRFDARMNSGALLGLGLANTTASASFPIYRNSKSGDLCSAAFITLESESHPRYSNGKRSRAAPSRRGILRFAEALAFPAQVLH
ncbi:hypothetical protein BJX68DRAFT_263644 [Aspergillus pseudodeflectus]|uniref:Uncharacterized protein n=1 Tax=Aspergillus pseudodeflectus TaxID=176178 RepID=A0ABR4KV29_9EURO